MAKGVWRKLGVSRPDRHDDDHALGLRRTSSSATVSGRATTPPSIPDSWNVVEPQTSRAAPKSGEIQPVSAVEPVSDRGQPRVERIAAANGAPSSAAERESTAAAGSAEVVAPQANAATTYPIDLPTALRLAQGDNLRVATLAKQITQAWAKYDAAQSCGSPRFAPGSTTTSTTHKSRTSRATSFPRVVQTPGVDLVRGHPAQARPCFRAWS